MTFILFIILLAFSLTKLLTLINKHQVDIFSFTDEKSIGYNDKFTSEDGLYVAAALTDFNTTKEIQVEEKYGELIFAHYGWGYDYFEYTINQEIHSHYCSDEEIGLKEDPDALVYLTRD